MREVEDFARILNSDWPERMQELLSLGQERKAMPFTSNGNRLDLMILSHKQEGISGKWILTSPHTNGLCLRQPPEHVEITIVLTKSKRDDIKQCWLTMPIHQVQSNICNKKTCRSKFKGMM
ncbi:hypothetical protein Ahy_B04g072118 isoform A [Arachis hypogaea]|uniref:Uncharacterized protein n=1 Tax=Arachis hypogaea TaxID=3818 RepID=A0A444ZMG4_ARAHY|nr:hypothetical protein Ahy_B04g072118 isoform A [Arachis hypogaea]